MRRRLSPWTTVFWMVPYTCGLIRASVWPSDSDAHFTWGSLGFVFATATICELLLRWYRYQVVTEVRRSRDNSMDEQESFAE